MIETEQTCAASAATVHELLVDVDAWALWAPHVASIRAEHRRVDAGWNGDVRAFFAPRATAMVVDRVHDVGGYDWHSTAGPWRLDYENRVRATPSGSAIRFSARVSGPGARLLERAARPFSTLGQRRRVARLAHLAELIERRAGRSGGHDAA